MLPEPVAVFVSREDPLELTVNFGVITGRELARSDVDSLGRSLLDVVSGCTILVGRRYEFAIASTEVMAYEARVEVPAVLMPAERAERESFVNRLLETVEAWTRRCAADVPTGGEDLAARIVRESATGH